MTIFSTDFFSSECCLRYIECRFCNVADQFLAKRRKFSTLSEKNVTKLQVFQTQKDFQNFHAESYRKLLITLQKLFPRKVLSQQEKTHRSITKTFSQEASPEHVESCFKKSGETP